MATFNMRDMMQIGGLFLFPPYTPLLLPPALIPGWQVGFAWPELPRAEYE